MAKKTRNPAPVHTTVPVGEIPAGFVGVSTGIPLANPGDTFVGTYIGKGGKQKLGRGEPAQMYECADDNGVVTQIAGSAILAKFFDGLQKGTRVWIRKTGKVEGGKGSVNQYQCAIDPTTVPKGAKATKGR